MAGWEIDCLTFLAHDGLAQYSRYWPTDSTAADIWPLLVSETLHHLRSALDNLAYALAHSHTPQLNSEQRGYVAFPITQTRKDWEADKIQRKIKSMAKDVRARILALQPLHAADVAAHPLTVLHGLQNKDKHRGVHLVVTGIPHAQLPLPDAVISGSMGALQRVEPGHDYLRIEYRTPQPDIYVNVGPPAIEHRIAHQDTTLEVVGHLTKLHEHVELVINDLVTGLH